MEGSKLYKKIAFFFGAAILLAAISVMSVSAVVVNWLTDDLGTVSAGNLVEDRILVKKLIKGESGTSPGGGHILTPSYWLSGFIDETGTLVVPIMYRAANDFSEGLAAVAIEEEIDGGQDFAMRWGFIDKENNVVVPLVFDSVTSFSGGIATVVKEGKVGIISNPLIAENDSGKVTHEVSRDLAEDNTIIVSFYNSHRILQMFPLRIPSRTTDIKVMVWNGFENIKPLIPAIEIK